MDDAENAIFSRAVNFVLPNSIPTHFDRSEEYQVGDVLVYEKKLHSLMPWRKHKLIFTGVNISSLLTESIQLDNGVQEVFSDSSSTWAFGESAKVDAEIRCAVAKLGIHVAESEHATMSVNFGRIDRHFSNLSHLPTRQAADKKFHVLADHPVIRDAKAHNRTLFVINNLYVAEKADISLSYTSGHGSKDTSTDTKQVQAPVTNPPTSTADTTGTTQQPQATPASGKTSTIGANIDLSVEMSGHSVVKRDMQTNIAYRVMRFKLGSHGSLLPQLRSSLHHYLKIKVVDENDFGGNVVDAGNQAEDKCDYTHDRHEVMAAREDEP